MKPTMPLMTLVLVLSCQAQQEAPETVPPGDRPDARASVRLDARIVREIDANPGQAGAAGTGGGGPGGANGGTAGGGSSGSAGAAGSGATGGNGVAVDASTPTADRDASVPAPTDGSSADPLEQARQSCVDTINALRATEGKPPYARWTDAESCADMQAMNDSQTKQAHGAFGKCKEFAQDECPNYGALGQITGCLQSMWKEGPGDFAGHGHYINMSSTKYKKVACGFFTTPDRKVWAVQDFH